MPAENSCRDPAALAEKGRDQWALGNLAAALGGYEAAWNCKQDPAYAEKSFLIACTLRSVEKAKLFWKRMPQAMKTRAVGICMRNGITDEMLNAP